MTKHIALALITTFIILGGCTMNQSNDKTNNEATAGSINDQIIPGQVGVGFEKGVTEEQAEAVLKKYELPYEKTMKINAGKMFFYKTELKYLISVPKGQEADWIRKLSENPEIKMAVFNYDPSKVMID